MAKIFFSICGEGRGHATRARAVVEQLRSSHEIVLYSSRDAFAFLAPIYAGTEVQLRRISGLRFRYTPDRRLNFHRTGWSAWHYLGRLPTLVRILESAIERDRPDLIITDFEPAMPRAAVARGVPFVSLDHQHFLTHYDMGSLPRHLRFHAAYMSWIVRAYYSGQAETIVSSFFFPPVRPGRAGVTQAGVLLRPEILAASREEKGHLVVYLRKFAGNGVLAALRDCGREVRVYGLGPLPAQGNLRFQAVQERRFLEDLASADALVSTAGNQLVGEALYLGKPALVMPEARNFEQYINAHFLKESAAGDSVELERMDAAALARFLSRLDHYRGHIHADRMNGLPAALAALRKHLPAAAAPPAKSVVKTAGAMGGHA